MFWHVINLFVLKLQTLKSSSNFNQFLPSARLHYPTLHTEFKDEPSDSRRVLKENLGLPFSGSLHIRILLSFISNSGCPQSRSLVFQARKGEIHIEICATYPFCMDSNKNRKFACHFHPRVKSPSKCLFCLLCSALFFFYSEQSW